MIAFLKDFLRCLILAAAMIAGAEALNRLFSTTPVAAGEITAPAPNGILAQLIQWLEQNWLVILKEILALFGH